MKWLEIAGANVTLAEGQDEYETIRVRKAITHLEVNGESVPFPCYIAELQPDAAELEQLNRGGSLFLQFLGTSWPPVALGVVDPALDRTDGNA